MLSVACLRQACRELGWTAIGPWPTRLLGVGSDTRQSLEDQLFVALIGERFDAHEFIDKANEQGAPAFLVQRLHAARLARRFPGVLVVGVEDTLHAMGELARLALKNDSRRVIAITGSAGKTSTRLACVAAAEAAGLGVHSQPGNENNRVGVPRFLLNLPAMQSSDELIIVECGTSEPGEIARLGAICVPDVAIVTSVCAAHTELLIDEDGVAHEKGDLLRSAHAGNGVGVFDLDDQRLARAAAEGGRRVVPLTSLNDEPSWQGAATHLRANGAKVLSALEALGVELSDAVVAAARIEPPPGRGGIIQIGPWRVMDDTYNANEASMVAALDAASSEAGDLPLVCFLGEMRELGTQADTAHRNVARYAVQAGCKFLHFAGPYAHLAAAEAKGVGAERVTAAANATDLEGQIKDLPRPAFILIKGSRGARMERILDALKEGC